jgi:hypothetical protein
MPAARKSHHKGFVKNQALIVDISLIGGNFALELNGVQFADQTNVAVCHYKKEFRR